MKAKKITKKNKSERINIFTKIKFPKAKLNLLTKLLLIGRGKRDGKRDIPYQDNNGNWISPTIQEESNRITALISMVYGVLTKSNTDNYVILEHYIAELEEKALELKRIHSFLSDKMTLFDKTICTTPNTSLKKEYDEILSAKRDSEKNLENMGIRIRRFNEYQQSLEPLRQKFLLTKKEFEQLFEVISGSFKQFRLIDEQVKYLYHEACAISDARLAWYWHGVLKKHKNNNTMKIDTPKTNDAIFRLLYDANIKSLDDRFDNLKNLRDEVLTFSIV